MMVQATIISSSDVARQRFCGRTLVERHEVLLRRAGVSDVRVVEMSGADGTQTAGDRAGCTLVVTAERIFDPRLYAAIYAAMLRTAGPVRVTDGGAPVGLEVVCAGDDGATSRPRGDAADLDIRSLEPYSRELRRHLPPYWMAVRGPEDRAAVTRLLVEASGKGHQDLPALVINAPIEKAAMRLLANTRVTPNQITAVCNLLAYAVAALIASGHLLVGAVGAIVVGVVDGLDGRQARIQLRTTPLGQLEHLLDKIYEVLWIVALAYTVSGGFSDRSSVTLLLVWIGAYLFDTAAYDAVKWKTGGSLDEASPLDARIRLIAGRRNVYACVLLVGVLLNRPAAAFLTIVWWAVVTAVVHGGRAAAILGRRTRVLV